MSPRISPLVLATVVALALQSALPASAQAPAPAKPEAAAPPAPAAPEAGKPATPPAAKPQAAPTAKPKVTVVQPKRFPSPEAAMEALVAALRAGDRKALVAIFGSEGRTLVSSGDAVADRQGRELFLAAYAARQTLTVNGNTAVLTVGTDDWPFPIPLVKEGERWRFDVRKGREEILARRIGRNELYTIQTSLAYVDAQREYYSQDRNGDGVLEYARQFASTPGKHDGLYWPTRPGEPLSPLGDLVVRARVEGYRREQSGGPTPFHGYLYRILTAQGPAAPDGAYDYIVQGHMIAGFGLVAFPAQYGVSGVMTFLVNHEGIVYQKDLGPKTRSIASAMRTFNPDDGWTKADVPEVTAASSAPAR
jgi:hypothetical protein